MKNSLSANKALNILTTFFNNKNTRLDEIKNDAVFKKSSTLVTYFQSTH